jgi:uncharacterized membrane protein YedE/YeeE
MINTQSGTKDPDSFWNPYLVGLAIAAILVATFLAMGKGVGASGASFRVGAWLTHVVAPAHAESVPAIAGTMEDRHPLDDWLVFEVVGMLAGGLVAAATSGRLRPEVLKSRGFSTGLRIALAVLGGVMMGFAAKLARGCTSGQALSGGAVQSVGSWAFMFSVFAGGYALAWIVRRQWR